jgi:hypothetical protein
MSDKKRLPPRQTARRTAGGGVPKTRRDDPQSSELKGRTRRQTLARINQSTRAAKRP